MEAAPGRGMEFTGEPKKFLISTRDSSITLAYRPEIMVRTLFWGIIAYARHPCGEIATDLMEIAPEAGTALCLSGGGYRAMLFYTLLFSLALPAGREQWCHQSEPLVSRN